MSAEIYLDAPDLDVDPDAVRAVKDELVTVEFAVAMIERVEVRATHSCVARTRGGSTSRALLIAVRECQADGSRAVRELSLEAAVAISRIDGPLVVGHGAGVEQIVAER